MRRRFLFSIGSLILTIALLSSCIKGENDEVAFSIDASVRAFSIDSINGVKYPFSIDLLRSSIYNKDSLPYLSDTLLKSFVIDTFSVSGAVFAADTMMSFPATVDLTKAMNGADGIMFTVYAADGRTTRNYRLDVRVHLQDPDSLSWGQIANLPEDFLKADLGTSPKVVNFGKQLLIFSSLDCYHTSLDNAGSYALEASAISGLPTSVDWSSLQLFDDLLFVRTAEGDIYTSADGQLWGKHPSLSGGVKTLLAGMSQLLLGIQTVDGTDYFCHAKADDPTWVLGTAVPADFPSANTHVTAHTTYTGVERVILTGDVPGAEAQEEVVPWFTLNGEEWAALDTKEMYCPYVGHPTILQYNDWFYLFGNGFEAMYESPSALTWSEVTSKFMLPAALKGKQCYSATVDADKYIWIVASEAGNNQLWRGRLNKFGFKRQ